MGSWTIRATIIQTPEPGRLEVLEEHTITVDQNGVIESVEPAVDPTDAVLAANVVLVPGLIDTHIHAPQWPQLGTGLDLPLEQWLMEYTFPLEARYADEVFARQVWERMVPRLLALGTTTAVYHASIHEPATAALAEACVQHGQRAFVGRVAMDHPHETPDWYRDPSPAHSVAASERSIEAIRSIAGPTGLVQPMVTPRFIPACTDAALEGLGELAASTGVRVQTHCSESDWEHEHVIDRHGMTGTASLDRFGLLRESTVLAHATHLTDADRRTITAREAGVSHCPLSNAYFAGRVFSARETISAGMSVGLGTDVAGGSDPSMFSQCAHAVAASRALEDFTGAPARIDITTAFWTATVGGATLLGIPAGIIAPGRVFDAVAVDTTGPGIGAWSDIDDWSTLFEKIVRNTGPEAIRHVWVQGREVATRAG